MRIAAMHKSDTPRERLKKYGPSKLADYELIAVVLGSGTKGSNVLQIAKKVTKILHLKDKTELQRRLIKVRGLGPARVNQILSIIELSSRLTNKPKKDIRTARDVWSLCSDIRESKKEHFVAFYINTLGGVIERRIVSVGTLTESLVHPRELFEPAVSLQAVSVILVHNHPSGDCNPSSADKAVTTRLIAAGALIGISVLDHVIVTEGQYLSFKERGLLS